MRIAEINRTTGETGIHIQIDLDGTGQYAVDTPCGFLTHMLELFARHGRFNLTLKATGDTHVDDHHLVEDTGILLGRAISQALGERRGICRYGSFLLPMDEALVQVAVDISGRAYLAYGLAIPTEKIGSFDSQLVQEFFTAFTRELGATLHLRQLAGVNSHHIAEAAFKGTARALAGAVRINADAADEIPSTKGTIL